MFTRESRRALCLVILLADLSCFMLRCRTSVLARESFDGAFPLNKPIKLQVYTLIVRVLFRPPRNVQFSSFTARSGVFEASLYV